MEDDNTFYLCDPSKNAYCTKEACQNECYFTKNKEYSKDNKEYEWSEFFGEYIVKEDLQ